MAEDDRARWDARHAAAIGEDGGATAEPRGGFLAEVEHLLPARGRAMDVACGRGGLALWLAGRGLEVTVVDVSGVALDALRTTAEAAGFAIESHVLDLDNDELPAGPFDLICCMHYRQLELIPKMVERLVPGGLIALEQHTVDNLQRHAKPSRRFLAERGELERVVLTAGAGRAVRVEVCEEGWIEGRAVARVLGRVQA